MPGRKKTIPVTAAEGPKKTRRPRKKAAMDTVEKAIVNEAAVPAEEEKVPAVPAAPQEVQVSESKENEPASATEEKPKKKRAARKKQAETEAVPAAVSGDKPKTRGRKKKAGCRKRRGNCRCEGRNSGGNYRGYYACTRKCAGN